MSTQSENSTTRSSDIAQQQLKNRGRTDNLHAHWNAASNLRRSRSLAVLSGPEAETKASAVLRKTSLGIRSPVPPFPACSARSDASRPGRHNADPAAWGRIRTSRHLGFSAAVFAMAAGCGRMSSLFTYCFGWGTSIQPTLRIVLLLSASQPEKRPSRSSVSRKSSRKSVGRIRVSSTYSRNPVDFQERS